MSSLGIMSGKKVNNNLGFCAVKEHKSRLCSETGGRNQFSSLCLSTARTTPSCRILMKLEFSGQILKKKLQMSNLMKILQVGAELFHADYQEDRNIDFCILLTVHHVMILGK
jgi:hypothetical protein